MSRWSAEVVRIGLAPGEAALKHAGETQVLASPERGIASLLPLLDDALAAPVWRARSVEVVLSQHFVRHILTSPPCRALAPAEEHALVRASLREIYGDMADQWHAQVHSQPPQFGLLGAAVDAAFIQQLDALLIRHGYRQIKIVPLATTAALALPKTFNGWWALIEPGWLSLFGATDGVWQHLAGQPIDRDWATELSRLVEREAELATLPSTSGVWLQSIGAGVITAPRDRKRLWTVLPGSATTQGALALAEC